VDAQRLHEEEFLRLVVVSGVRGRSLLQISNQMQRVVGTSQYQGTISVKLSKHSLLPGTGNPPEGTRRPDSEAKHGQFEIAGSRAQTALRRIFDSG
jgi:hypothetical protein